MHERFEGGRRVSELLRHAVASTGISPSSGSDDAVRRDAGCAAAPGRAGDAVLPGQNWSIEGVCAECSRLAYVRFETDDRNKAALTKRSPALGSASRGSFRTRLPAPRHTGDRYPRLESVRRVPRDSARRSHRTSVPMRKPFGRLAGARQGASGLPGPLHSCGAPFQNGCWEVRGSKPGSPVIAWEPRSRRWPRLCCRGRASSTSGRRESERRLRLAIRWSVRQALRRLLRPGDASAAGLSWLRPRSGHDVYRSERKGTALRRPKP